MKKVSRLTTVSGIAMLLTFWSAAAIATDIPVPNSSFESPVLAVSGTLTPTGWTGTAKAYRPNSLNVVTSDGSLQVLFCRYDVGWTAGAATVVPAISQAGATYTLSTKVGTYYSSSTPWVYSGYKLEILVNNVSVATLAGTESPGPGPSSWFTRSLAYTTAAADVGKPLAIRLSNGSITTGFRPTVLYDNVTLDGVVPVDIPVTNSSFELPGLTLGNTATPTGWTGTAKAYFPNTLNIQPFDGNQVLFCRYDVGWMSGTTTMIPSIAEAGQSYTLSTKVGTYKGNVFAGYKLEFLVDNVSVATVTGAEALADFTWLDRFLAYTTVAEDVGKPLAIRLSLGDVSTGFRPSVVYDKVTLQGPGTGYVAVPSFSPMGGNYADNATVTISCPTDEVSIYYTTDGTDPDNVTGTLYTGSVVLSQTAKLKARAYSASGGFSDIAASSTYVMARPRTIPYVYAITLDGNLTEWTNADWAPLDQPYFMATTETALNADVPEAYYAAKWGANNRLYVAVKVRDLNHVFKDVYDDYNTRDAVEIYVHTTGTETGNDYSSTQASAQQYSVGIKNSDNTSVWTDIGYKKGLPAEANFQAAGKADGEWLYYEAALTPYEVFSLTGQGLVVSPLSADQAIGLDVVAIANDGTTGTVGEVGAKSENMLLSKFRYCANFGLHRLEAAPALHAGDANGDGMVDVGDLGILAANYGGSDKTWALGDFNDDGLVDVGDLGILAANYGFGAEAAMDFNADYAKAFGTDSTEDDAPAGITCPLASLPLIVGLLLACLGLVESARLKD